MWFLGIAAPLGFLALLLFLAWLEDGIVRPLERAARITDLLERTPPDEVETVVAQMLAPLAPRRAEAS
jgi:hypothetical protein